MLVLQNVSVVRGKRKILDGADLTIEPGEFVCIVGKSGSGKTTILELLSGMRSPTSGVVEVDGVDLRSVPPAALQLYRRRLGIAFEDGKLFPRHTVAENVAYALEVCGAPNAYIRTHVAETLEKVGLSDRAEELTEDLTGDERQRTAIARAIVHSPLIVLADEPTALLDAEEASSIRSLLLQAHHDGATVVVFTHSRDTAAAFGGRIVELSDGKIVGMRATNPAPPVKHQVFNDARPAEVPLEQDAVTIESQEKMEGGGKKIRVTSIRSE